MTDDKKTDDVAPTVTFTELDEQALDTIAGGVPKTGGNVPSMDDWEKHNV